MRIIETNLSGVLVVASDVHADGRGFFLETWNLRRYTEAGLDACFVQDNLSRSSRGVLRGLHFQNPQAQGKLVYVLQGAVFDVAVDIRPRSPTFGQWAGVTLSDENRHQLFVPQGFAHGFCVVSENALFAYKCTDFYNPVCEKSIRWNDADIGIDWPIRDPQLSSKDQAAPCLRDIPAADLPEFRGAGD